MVLGASPTSKKHHETPKVDTVAGAGSSITFHHPDWFFIIEERSLMLYPDDLKTARLNGTKVVIKKHLIKHCLEKMYRERRIASPDYPHDLALDLFGGFKNGWRVWEPGMYVNCTAGAFALQFAVNHNPAEIHMVGLEGYTGGVDYFDGKTSNEQCKRYSRQVYAPLLQRIVDKCPQTQFITYGNPIYKLSGKNVSHYG